MDGRTMTEPWTLRIPFELMNRLEAHLFPGDGDEHGAVLVAGMVETDRGTRLLARDLVTAIDGVDYLPGTRGYRMLTASFVTDNIMRCASERLVYLAVHCHGGSDVVGFSPDDFASHERGYPALLDIANGMPVGALVFAEGAVAGDIWLPGGRRVVLTQAIVTGRPQRLLLPAPPPRPQHDSDYDRQARIFGDRGQAILRTQRVGVIGAGGAGSLIVEYLARLGVGHLVLCDPERIETSNLPRVVGSTRLDALTLLTADKRSRLVKYLGRRFARYKTSIAARVARKANRQIIIEQIRDDITNDSVAQHFIDCDFLFLAADSQRARLVFNAIVNQYLIPGAQVGAKVRVTRATGEIGDVHSVFRPVLPDSGCLWCNGLVLPSRLQEEAIGESERLRQRYVEDESVKAPSVISLNAVACAHAVDDYLFSVTGLLKPGTSSDYRYFYPRQANFVLDKPLREVHCPECGRGQSGRSAVGSARGLPTRWEDGD
jgi:molybdopterin/thiamine biosynthesis adenylyltransferase